MHIFRTQSRLRMLPCMCSQSIFLLAVIAVVVSAGPEDAEALGREGHIPVGQEEHIPDLGLEEDAPATGDEEVNDAELTEEEMQHDALANSDPLSMEHGEAEHNPDLGVEEGASATGDVEEHTCATPTLGSVHSYLQHFDGFSLTYFDGRGL